MSAGRRASAASSFALSAAAAPPAEPVISPLFSSDAAGHAGSRDALAKLESAVSGLKAMAIAPMLQQALSALKANDDVTGSKWALKALEVDERSGEAWYILGIAREQAGDFGSAIKAYEAALLIIPDHAEIANDLGRLAYRLGLKPEAEKLFQHYLARRPDSTEAVNNIACAIRDQGRYGEAIGWLRPAILENQDNSQLWNTMGTILAEQGDPTSALTFFDEAVRLEPDFAKAHHNSGTARHVLGDAAGALVSCDRAMAGAGSKSDYAMMRLSRATLCSSLGRVAEGWDDYEARLDPYYADVVRFVEDRSIWTPQTDLRGKTLLVFGEQGVGDEVMFANLLPDVIDALGPDGRLILAVEKRLEPLFARSFPQARVGPHVTLAVSGQVLRGAPFLGEAPEVDVWAPIGSLLRGFRTSVAAFPHRDHYFEADPKRVAHWREVLKTAPGGPKVGLLWKSLKMQGARARYFSPFERWAPVLRTPGVSFVNLQYGDCSEEIAAAKREHGVDIWQPPGIDLKDDLDDVAALCCAMDLVIGFSNATMNLAGACGVPIWLLTSIAAWTQLGTDAYPWYPQAKVFTPTEFQAWGPTMDQVAAELGERFGLH